MHNLEGPIPVWPDETTTIGATYGPLQQIALAKALAILNTDISTTDKIKAITQNIDEAFKPLEESLEEHIIETGAVHGEDRINTNLYYLNNYPDATERQILDGRTYEALLTPNGLSYAYKTVKRDYQSSLLASGVITDNKVETRTLGNLPRQKGSVGSLTGTDVLQSLHWEGRVYHLVRALNSTCGVASDPIVMADLGRLNPVANFFNKVVKVGWGSPSTKFTGNLNAAETWFFVNNPLWFGFQEHLGVWDGDKLKGFPGDPDLLITGQDTQAFTFKATVDSTGIVFDAHSYETSISHKRVGARPDTEWTVEFLAPGGTPLPALTWDYLFGGTEPTIEVVGKPNVSYDWIEEDYGGVVLLDGVIKLDGKDTVFRIYIYFTLDRDNSKLQFNWSMKLTTAEYRNGGVISTGGWLYPTENESSPFYPIDASGIFTETIGHITAYRKDNQVVSVFYEHSADTLLSFVEGLPLLPEVKSVRTQTGAIENGALLPGIKRLFCMPDGEGLAVMRARDGRFTSAKFNTGLKTNGTFYGTDVNYRSALLNETKGVGSTITSNIWGPFNGYGSGGLVQFADDGSSEGQDIPVNLEWMTKLGDFVKATYSGDSRWMVIRFTHNTKEQGLLLVSLPNRTIDVCNLPVKLTDTEVTGGVPLAASKLGTITLTGGTEPVSVYPEFSDIYTKVDANGTVITGLGVFLYGESLVQFTLKNDLTLSVNRTQCYDPVKSEYLIQYPLTINGNGEVVVTTDYTMHTTQPYETVVINGNNVYHTPSTAVTLYEDGIELTPARPFMFNLVINTPKYLYFKRKEVTYTPYMSDTLLNAAQLKSLNLTYYGYFNGSVMSF